VNFALATSRKLSYDVQAKRNRTILNQYENGMTKENEIDIKSDCWFQEE